MTATLLEPFTYEYMLNAMWVSALVGGVCAFLSCYLMLKGWSLIGDALSHAIVPGVAGAYMLGLPFSIGAFFSGGLAAAAMLFLNQRTKLREDAIIGLTFSSFFALGLFMVSLRPMAVNIQTIVLGNVLAITPEDTLQLVDCPRRGQPPGERMGQAFDRKAQPHHGLAAQRGTQDRVRLSRRRRIKMTAMRPRPLVEIAEAAIAAFDKPSARQNDILQRIRRHAERLAADRFQLAVLGQFKRGKSTLLNALIGHRLLATGILPLTAIPTFLSEGERPAIELTYLDGRVEREEASDWRELAQKIAEATTEEKNPGNVRHLQRVDVTLLPGTLLDSMALIDTPGVGSTYSHNTEAAEDVLPECDAALFVVSADPPITEVELKYLGQICRSVPHVVVVLNKVDLFGNDDREKALSFLKTVLSGADLPQVDPNSFLSRPRQPSMHALPERRLASSRAD